MIVFFYRVAFIICLLAMTCCAFVPRTNSVHRSRRTSLAAEVAVLAEITPQDVLTLVSNTDRGATASRALQDAVNMWIFDQADAYRNRTTTSALDDPLLFGNYDVAFVATSRAQAQEGNPAGGRFRGRLGRLLYRNEGLYQNILRDTEGRTLAVNYIRGRLFSRVPLSVILRGVVAPLAPVDRAALTTKYGTPLSAGTVRADFEPPLVTLGGIGLRVGPPSSVVLDTPYVDAAMRLGVGSRGSTFLFKRTSDALADGWKADLARRPFKVRATCHCEKRPPPFDVLPARRGTWACSWWLWARCWRRPCPRRWRGSPRWRCWGGCWGRWGWQLGPRAGLRRCRRCSSGRCWPSPRGALSKRTATVEHTCYGSSDVLQK